MRERLTKIFSVMVTLVVVITAGSASLNASAQTGNKPDSRRRPQLRPDSKPRKVATARAQAKLGDGLRHQLAGLPHYGVYDWLEYSVRPDGTVVLRGEVTDPTTKGDADARVHNIEGVKVDDRIEVLPVSPNDEQLRFNLFDAIYGFNSPLFRYGLSAVPPIHIIVRSGRATLKGTVATRADGEIAYMRARQVPGLFAVTNELQVEHASQSEVRR